MNPQRTASLIGLISASPQSADVSAFIRSLRLSGFEVTTTADYETVAQWIGQRSPVALVVHAYHPAVEQALEACRQLETHAPNIPILVIVPELATVEAALAAGADDCILAPMSHTLLVRRLRHLIQARAHTRAYDTIANRVSRPVMITSLQNNTVTVANREMCLLLGYKRSELQNKSLFQLVPEHSRRNLLAMMQTALKDDTCIQEMSLVDINGKAIRTLLLMNPLDEDQMILQVEEVIRASGVKPEDDDETPADKYQHVFHATNDAILIIDIQTEEILDANKAAIRLFGYSYDELTTMTYRAIRHKVSDTDSTAKILNTEGRILYETEYTRKDGRTVPVEISARIIRYENRPAFVSIIRDITRRKENERTREEQRLVLDALRENISAISQTLDLRTVLDRILQSVETVIPCDRSNILLIDDDAIYLAGLREYNQQTEYIEDRQPFDLERWSGLRWIYHNRQTLYVPDTRQHDGWTKTRLGASYLSYIGSPLIIDDKVIGFINIDGATVDQFTPQQVDYLRVFADQASTAIRNARMYEAIQLHAQELEARVAKRTRQLSEERNLLRTLLDNLPDPIYVKDRDGVFILVNAATLNFVRRSNPEFDTLIGKTDYDIMSREPAGRWREQESQIMESGEPLNNYELISRHPVTGEEAVYLISKVPLRDADGNVTSILGINRDISQLRRAQDEVSQIISGANCLLWYATVTRNLDNGRLMWDVRIPDELSAQRFMPIQLERGERYAQAWDRHINADDIIQLQRITDSALSSGAGEYSFSARMTTVDKRIRWVHFAVRAHPIDENKWQIIGVCTDVSAQKELEENLRRANETLERRVLERTARYVEANEGLLREIAERQRMADQLQVSEERYRTLANQLPVGVYQTTPQSHFQYVNHTLAQMLGYEQDPDSLLGVSAFRFYADPEEVARQQNDARQKTGIVRNEIRLINRHGAELWVRNTWQAIRKETGGISFFGGVIEDITERRRAQDAERAQRMLAEALSTAAADLNNTLELDEVLDRILLQIARVMPPHQGSSIVLVEENDIAHIIRYRRETDDVKIYAPREPYFPLSRIRNLVNIRETGEPIIISDTHNTDRWQTNVTGDDWIRSYIGVPIIINAEVIGFINLGSDVPNTFQREYADRLMAFANQVGTAIKNARLYARVQSYADDLRRQVEDRTAKLRQQTRLLDAILNAMTEGVTYFDTEKERIVFTNRALETLTGYTEQEIIDIGSITGLFLLGEKSADEQRADIIRQVSGAGMWNAEAQLKRKDGAIADMRITVTPVSGDHDMTGLVTVIRDVTRDKILEQERRKFIAYASHELRTPISNLSMRLYLMRKQPEKLDSHMDILESVIYRMRQLAEDLLDLSRLENGVINLRRQVVDVRNLIHDIVTIHAPEAERKQITVVQAVGDESAYISVDVPRFSRALINLLTNAVNYTQDGGTVTFEVSQTGQEVIVRVRDDGAGIAPDVLPDIFKLFVRGRNDGVGSGLGLTITKELIEMHNGTIEVESEIGVGTTFTVRLDRAEPVNEISANGNGG